MQRYNPADIEPKWQKKWTEDKLYRAVDFDESRPKFVMLTEFPYPSGDGLHLGHVREYTLGDIIARYKRMHGHNVLYPMGYDSFGLPTENYAIKNNIPPQVATSRNIANFQKQFDSLGYSIDWDRAFSTTDPDYYKWTQWLFLQFFKAGLAYQDEIAINWCPKCKTGLANEEVVNGRHERCGTLVEEKLLKQWLLKITDYADRLIEGLETVDYPSRIADQQVNWIGRSVGAEIDFVLHGANEKIRVFTTRPDTIFGATYMVLAPEHPLVQKITTKEQQQAVEAYVKQTQSKSEIERQEQERQKTGAFTGAYAVNPANGEKIPIWIADYVLMGYGTGAIMAVPAHDERDFAFAKQFGLPITQVIAPKIIDPDHPPMDGKDNTKRRVAMCVIEHPSDGTYLTIRWKKHKWHNLVTGGVEDGEELVETAQREITEETGFTDLSLKAQLPLQINCHFYAAHKDLNRDIMTTVLLFKLNSLDQVETKKELHEDFEVEWTPKEKLADLWPVSELPYILRWLSEGEYAYTGEGTMINSKTYDGMESSEARDAIVADLASKDAAVERVNYRLRDWIFSRQHYWGEPIPIIHCQKDGAVAVPDEDLPVTLPEVEAYQPTDTGESPLAAVEEWVNTTCPKCGGPAKRETDTMPNWAGSSWYYLRYYDAHNDKAFADRKKLEYWGEVDLYLGGMEHTTLHLLYSRFWHQFLYDQGLVPTAEPYRARRGQGIILAEDGTKMSKSRGNIVNPTDIIEQGYGADALRLAIAFLAPYDQTTPWSPEGVAGTHRFLNRVWTLTHEHLKASGESEPPLPAVHRVIKKVTDDIDKLAFNTAIAALMELVNELYKVKNSGASGDGWRFAIESLLRLLAPFAPHISEELWAKLGHEGSVHTSDWPKWDEKYLIEDEITIAVQVNGKVRAQITIPADADEQQAIEAAKSDAKVTEHIKGKDIKKALYIRGRLVSLVV